GFLPEFHPNVNDYSGVGGFRATVSGWSLDLGASFGMNRFDYDMRNTNNASLGPCLTAPCAPGPDRVFGTADDPGIPNQLSTDAGDHSRTNFGTYLDLESDLTSHLLADVAGRFEHYSDFGSRVTGKVALRFQPTKRFVLRGAASTGFRAPGLSQSFFSHTTTN